MLNKMQQESGKNSHNVQIAGDMHNHYGLSVADAYEICRNVIKQELSIYFGESLQTAEARFEVIANKTIDRIIAEKPQLLPKFREPDIQIAVNETYKKYIESGDDELGENLIYMLIERLESENRDTAQFVIDDARNILPKMSQANLAFLAFHVFKLLNLPFNSRREYIDVVKKLRPVVEKVVTISKLDIEYLKQSSCAMGIQMIQSTRGAADCILKTYEYYFSDGISTDELNRLYAKHHISAEDLGLILALVDPMPKGRILLKISNKNRIVEAFSKNENLKVQSFIEEFVSIQRKPNIQDVKQFHSNIDILWNEAFSVLDQQKITSLSVMPVGVYIGSVYLSRVLGIKIPQDIFYN